MEEPRYFTPEKERCLIRAAQKGVDWARDELILGCLPFVSRALRRRYPSVSDQDFEDIVQEAIPPLYECIDRYDMEHPARARLYVFAARHIHNAVCEYFRHHKLLSYSDQIPELLSTDDPQADAESSEATRLTRSALSTLSDRDRDVLCSRHAGDRAISRRELAERYQVPPHVIEYAERRAIERFIAALRVVDPSSELVSVN
jgi:RNA polymerase sigma factor (sigma-70 family)